MTSTQEIAERQQCSVRQINRAITLAFLSPRIVEAAIDVCQDQNYWVSETAPVKPALPVSDLTG